MTLRQTRLTAALLATIAGLLALIASPATAQESTPAADQPVIVGETEVSWTGDWQYDAANASPEQAHLIQLNLEIGAIMLVSYGEFAESPVGAEGEQVEGSQAVIDTFSEGLAQGLGADAVQETGSGELEDGTIWKLFEFDLEGIQLTLLVTVSQAENDAYVVETLVGTTDTFGVSLATAQAEILLDGEPAFLDGIEPEDVGAEPVATPQATPGV